MSRPSLPPRMFLFVLALALGLGNAAWAQPAGDALPYSRGYLLTGNYVAGSVDLTEKANPVNGAGFSSGTIGIAGVPVDADIVAAYLYWETITLTSDLSQAKGVRFRGTEILLNDVMAVKKSSQPLTGSTAGCWSSGVPLTLTHFRADVLRLLPIRLDAKDQRTGKRLVNSADLVAHGLPEHTVTLPTRNGNQVPESAGATLVIVYRDPAEPLRKVVFYDGLHIQPTVHTAMTQTLQGFYRSSAARSARLTHIAASGQPNATEQVLFDNGVPVLLASDPFVGGSASQRWWGTATYEVGPWMRPGNRSTGGFGETAATRVDHKGRGKGGYDCLTWSAVIFSTAVADVEHDGLPDGIEDAAAGLSDPPSAAFPDGQPLPNLRAMGASSAQRDLFIEFNAMRTEEAKTHGSADAPYPKSPTPGKSVPAHTHMPTPQVLKQLGDLYLSRGIVPHFDVGDWTAYGDLGTFVRATWTDDFASDVAHQYLVPSALARGGEVVDERACSAESATCQFPDYPGTVSWKVGLQLYRDGPVGHEGEELLTPGDVAAWQLGERRRRFDTNRKGLFHYVLNAHARGKPRSPLPCLVNGEPADYDAPNRTCTTRNPEFHIPTSASGVADLPGSNAMVTLGFWDEHVGSPFVRASTIFHEVGHNLNLWHGGRPAIWGNRALGTDTIVEPNCKPTYLSAMSYLFQVHGLFDDSDTIHLDFSGTVPPPINEMATLVDATLLPVTGYRPVWYAPTGSPLALEQGSPEATRYCSGQPFGPTPPAPMARVRAVRADAVIDWNGDLLTNTAVDEQDVNFDAALHESLEGFDDWASIRLDQIGAGRHAVKFQNGDFLDFGSGDFLDFGSGDFLDFGSGDLLNFGSGDFVDFGSGDFVDFGSGVVFSGAAGDFLDFGSGDFVDFGSGDFVDFGSGDFLDFGSGSERQELDFEFASSLGRGPAYQFTTCIVGQDATCAAVDPFAPTYHRIEVNWTAPTFGSVFNYAVERKRGTVSSAFPYVALGTVPTASFTDGELPDGVAFTYRTRTEFDDETPHPFSGYSLPITVTAVNQAPLARDDSYTSPRTGVLVTTRAAGVLANDEDVDSPAANIRTVLVTGPRRGGLVLNADGTFKYVPVSGFTGTDSFTYRTNNGRWSEDPTVPMSPDSNVATVTIVVGP